MLLAHGGHRKLRSYKMAQAVYDATVVCCRRFHPDDRPHDRPNGASRAQGVRNISEGSGKAATSRNSEMKLTNVARARLADELLRDFESFLVQRGLRVWPKDSREAKARRTRSQSDWSEHSDKPPACPNCGKLMLKAHRPPGQQGGPVILGLPGLPRLQSYATHFIMKNLLEYCQTTGPAKCSEATSK